MPAMNKLIKIRALVRFKLLAMIFGTILCILILAGLWQFKHATAARLLEPASPAAACPNPTASWSPGEGFIANE